jgi:hypothetical protein
MSVTTSQLAAANEALAELKQVGGITAISDIAGTTTEQKYVTRFFETCRKGVLRAHDWPFARKSMCIAAAQDEETGTWYFSKPTDCIRILSVTCQGVAVSYEIEGANIVSLTQPDRIKYTEDVTDIDLWDTLARQAFVHLLASKLAEPISGRINAWEKHFNLYKDTVGEAILASARESHKHYGSRKSGSPDYPHAMSTRFPTPSTSLETILREIPT